MEQDPFYSTKEWKMMRWIALKMGQFRCSSCKDETSQLHVDHIQARSKFPEKELDLKNLQVLCKDCNRGKSDWDDDYYKGKPVLK